MLNEEKRGTRRKGGRGGKRDEKEGGTRRKEGREGSRNGESEKMKKLLKEMKNEKVAKGRIIGLAGPCFNKEDQANRRSSRSSKKGKRKRSKVYGIHIMDARTPIS